MIYKENIEKERKNCFKRSKNGGRFKSKGIKSKINKVTKEYGILTMSLILMVVGYVSYLSKYQVSNQTNGVVNEVADIGDATLVNSKEILENNTVDDDTIEAEKESNEGGEAGECEETETTNAKPETEEYFISSRLERENMYSQTIETYQDILENTNCSVEQRNEASEKINEINETKNSIMISENLIKTKGFEDCVIFVNSDSVSIVVKKEELTQEDIAKIQNIAVRELSENLENIHISNKY